MTALHPPKLTSYQDLGPVIHQESKILHPGGLCLICVHDNPIQKLVTFEAYSFEPEEGTTDGPGSGSGPGSVCNLLQYDYMNFDALFRFNAELINPNNKMGRYHWVCQRIWYNKVAVKDSVSEGEKNSNTVGTNTSKTFNNYSYFLELSDGDTYNGSNSSNQNQNLNTDIYDFESLQAQLPDQARPGPQTGSLYVPFGRMHYSDRHRLRQEMEKLPIQRDENIRRLEEESKRKWIKEYEGEKKKCEIGEKMRREEINEEREKRGKEVYERRRKERVLEKRNEEMEAKRSEIIRRKEEERRIRDYRELKSMFLDRHEEEKVLLEKEINDRKVLRDREKTILFKQEIVYKNHMNEIEIQRINNWMKRDNRFDMKNEKLCLKMQNEEECKFRLLNNIEEKKQDLYYKNEIDRKKRWDEINSIREEKKEMERNIVEEIERNKVEGRERARNGLMNVMGKNVLNDTQTPVNRNLSVTNVTSNVNSPSSQNHIQVQSAVGSLSSSPNNSPSSLSLHASNLLQRPSTTPNNLSNSNDLSQSAESRRLSNLQQKESLRLQKELDKLNLYKTQEQDQLQLMKKKNEEREYYRRLNDKQVKMDQMRERDRLRKLERVREGNLMMRLNKSASVMGLVSNNSAANTMGNLNQTVAVC